MAAIVRAGFSVAKKSVFNTSFRVLSTSKRLNLKEIRERNEGSSLVIQGVNVPSPQAEVLIQPEKIDSLVETNHSLLAANEIPEKKLCYMCALGLDVKHTDVLILSQFVRSDGCMLPRRITGLCRRQQKKVGKLVTMAQKAGLMINLTPSWCQKDPTKRRNWKQFNTYFDERTIFWKKIPRQEDKFKR